MDLMEPHKRRKLNIVLQRLYLIGAPKAARLKLRGLGDWRVLAYALKMLPQPCFPRYSCLSMAQGPDVVHFAPGFESWSHGVFGGLLVFYTEAYWFPQAWTYLLEWKIQKHVSLKTYFPHVENTTLNTLSCSPSIVHRYFMGHSSVGMRILEWLFQPFHFVSTVSLHIFGGLWLHRNLLWGWLGYQANEGWRYPNCIIWCDPWRSFAKQTGCNGHFVRFRVCVAKLNFKIYCFNLWFSVGCFSTWFTCFLLPKPFQNGIDKWKMQIKFRLVLLSILNAKMDNFFTLIGLVCSSWVTISQGTHNRAPWSPLGMTNIPFVKDGNQMTSRPVCVGGWFVSYSSSTLGGCMC